MPGLVAVVLDRLADLVPDRYEVRRAEAEGGVRVVPHAVGALTLRLYQGMDDGSGFAGVNDGSADWEPAASPGPGQDWLDDGLMADLELLVQGRLWAWSGVLAHGIAADGPLSRNALSRALGLPPLEVRGGVPW